MDAQNLLVMRLKEHGYSATKSRTYIFETLMARGHSPMTLQELLQLTGDKTDRASVYRTVELFERIGIIKRLYLGWKYKLELSDDFHAHHHHMTCTRCGKVHATHDDSSLEELLSRMAATCGFSMTDHQVEIKGVCTDCQPKI